MLDTIRETITRPKPWSEPRFDSPVVIDAGELEPLGTAGRYVWWRHKKYGELRERPALLTDDDVMPDRLMTMTKVDGERRYGVLDAFAPGSFAAALAGPAPRVQRAARPGPVDGWLGLPILRPSDRGGEAIDARLVSAGYPTVPAANGRTVTPIPDLGRDGPNRHIAVAAVLAAAGPLVLAHKLGTTIPCEVTTGCADPARTQEIGGAWWCMSCNPTDGK